MHIYIHTRDIASMSAGLAYCTANFTVLINFIIVIYTLAWFPVLLPIKLGP